MQDLRAVPRQTIAELFNGRNALRKLLTLALLTLATTASASTPAAWDQMNTRVNRAGIAMSGLGIVNLRCFEGIVAFAITLALLQAIEFTEVRFSD